MTLERRLQHAARELREVEIEVPPLGSRPSIRRRSRTPAMVAPLLVPAMFAIGALFAVGATRGAVAPPTSSDISVVQPAASTSGSPGSGLPELTDEEVSAPSVLTELEMIAELVRRQRANAPAAGTSTASPSTSLVADRIMGPI